MFLVLVSCSGSEEMRCRCLGIQVFIYGLAGSFIVCCCLFLLVFSLFGAKGVMYLMESVLAKCYVSLRSSIVAPWQSVQSVCDLLTAYTIANGFPQYLTFSDPSGVCIHDVSPPIYQICPLRMCHCVYFTQRSFSLCRVVAYAPYIDNWLL